MLPHQKATSGQGFWPGVGPNSNLFTVVGNSAMAAAAVSSGSGFTQAHGTADMNTLLASQMFNPYGPSYGDGMQKVPLSTGMNIGNIGHQHIAQNVYAGQAAASPGMLNHGKSPVNELDLSKPLSQQRPVLRRGRLKRAFEPHRKRNDYAWIEDPKERRRMRSQDNARLYRDREKQRIVDLETNIETLTAENNQLTVENSNLTYKFTLLKNYLDQEGKELTKNETDAEVSGMVQKVTEGIKQENEQGVVLDSQLGGLDQTTQMEMSALTNSNLEATIPIGNVSYNVVQELNNKYRVEHREQHYEVAKAFQVISNPLEPITNNSSEGSGGSQRNKLGLRLDISSNSSTKTITQETTNADMTTSSLQIGEPLASSSTLDNINTTRSTENMDDASNYGSAEPSPVELKTQQNTYNFSGAINFALQQPQYKF